MHPIGSGFLVLLGDNSFCCRDKRPGSNITIMITSQFSWLLVASVLAMGCAVTAMFRALDHHSTNRTADGER